MSGKTVLSEIKSVNDYEYISNDPQENADNFDPRWAAHRKLLTSEERYKALRKRWGNSEIPDPQINLTYRHIRCDTDSEKKKTLPNNVAENSASNSKTESVNAEKCPVINRSRRNRQVSRRRSRSCTRPYEQLISNLEKNYKVEYFQLMFKQSAELQEMLQIQFSRIDACNHINAFGNRVKEYLYAQQNKEVFHLLSNHYNEVQNLLGKKDEHIDLCKRYVEEIKSFFTFYQKINDYEVTLQMTDEEYEHMVETEKMYSLYNTFYN